MLIYCVDMDHYQYYNFSLCFHGKSLWPYTIQMKQKTHWIIILFIKRMSCLSVIIDTAWLEEELLKSGIPTTDEHIKREQHDQYQACIWGDVCVGMLKMDSLTCIHKYEGSQSSRFQILWKCVWNSSGASPVVSKVLDYKNTIFKAQKTNEGRLDLSYLHVFIARVITWCGVMVVPIDIIACKVVLQK